MDASRIVVNSNGESASSINGIDFSGEYLYLRHLTAINNERSDYQAVSKNYVDNFNRGINILPNVNYATISKYESSDCSENMLYLDGSENGITQKGLLFSPKYSSIDGIRDINQFKQGDSVLVNNQVNPIHNGIYEFYIRDLSSNHGNSSDSCYNFYDDTDTLCYNDASQNWFLERRHDLSHGLLASRVYVFVSDGCNNKFTSWLQSNDPSSVVVGDGSLNFILYSAVNDYKSSENISIDSYLKINLNPDISVNSIDSTSITSNTITTNTVDSSQSTITTAIIIDAVIDTTTIIGTATINGTTIINGMTIISDASIDTVDVSNLNVSVSAIFQDISTLDISVNRRANIYDASIQI